MIIIHTEIKCNHISQKLYDKFVKRAILEKILKDSDLEDFVIHGTYTRMIPDENGSLTVIEITRIRVGNKTHAVFLSPMIPYLHCYSDDVIEFDFITPVSEAVRYYLIRVLKDIHDDYEKVCSRCCNCVFFHYVPDST